MKHLKIPATMVFACLAILFMASCLKTKNEPAPPISGISFIDASPDGPSITLYLDQNRINNNLFIYPDNTGYLNAYSGNRGVYAYEGTDKKVSDTIKLDPQKTYSLFLAGKWASAKFVLFEDSLSKPDAGKANIRFVNMSVDAPGLDLGLNDGSTLISNKAYKTNSDFIAVNGDKKYTFVIRDHGTPTDTAKMVEVTLAAGHIYTVWANGIFTATGTSGLGGAIMENF